MSPHGTYTISPEHLTDLAAIAKSWDNSLFAIHISENAAENADVISRYGKTPTKLLATTGALDGDLRVVFGHGVHLDAEDREIVAKAKVAVAHCPGSNLKLASGALRWQQYRADGVRVGIGTDGCSSSNDLDMFQALRQAGLLARLTLGRADQTPAIDFIRGATIEGARAVGMGDVIGSIEVGKRADLVLLDLDAPHLVPVNDVHALIVFAAGRGDVCDVYVDGELVLDNRKSTRIDHKELLSKSRARGAVAAEAAAKA
jgi:5-methylthioadenosine/S-adenosylhomocysteine deaminase